MIQPNEIRVNNYYNRIDSINHSKLGFCKWDSSDWYRIGECIDYLENYEPIHLTEEILLKCGFDRICNNFEYDWLLIHTHLSTGEFHFLLNESKSGKLKVTNLKYVHQLQNLYFALTNEELTINL